MCERIEKIEEKEGRREFTKGACDETMLFW